MLSWETTEVAFEATVCVDEPVQVYEESLHLVHRLTDGFSQDREKLRKLTKLEVAQIQKVCGTTPDGILGPRTLKALEYLSCAYRMMLWEERERKNLRYKRLMADD